MELSSAISIAALLAALGGAVAYSNSRAKSQKASAPAKHRSPARSAGGKTQVPYGRKLQRSSGGSAISVEGRGHGRPGRKPRPNTVARKPLPPYETGPDAHRDRIGLVAFHERGFVMMPPYLLDSPRITERFRLLRSRIDGVGTNITDGLRKAIDLACGTPRGRRRRIVLLSDGEANRETQALFDEVARAERNFINIDCIAFGPDASRNTLAKIAAGTHNGQMIAVNSLRGLSDALTKSAGAHVGGSKASKPQTTIYCIDASISMRMQMPGESNRQRIEVVEECLFRLLACKQHAFA